MKRPLMTALLMVAALLLATSAFADQDDPQGYPMGPGMMGYGGGYGMGPGTMGGYGGHGMGPGMMGGGYGMGPGMMGGGYGMGMMGMNPLSMHPQLAQLPAEKQEQLQQLHVGMMKAMIQKRADLQVKALDLMQTMRAFPLDQKAARKQWAALDQARKEMFELRVSMMAQVQQIVGKELWQQMHSGAPYGMGPYGGGHGHGPGMMGGAMGPGTTGPRTSR